MQVSYRAISRVNPRTQTDAVPGPEPLGPV